jgi:hypothetical protein
MNEDILFINKLNIVIVLYFLFFDKISKKVNMCLNT